MPRVPVLARTWAPRTGMSGPRWSKREEFVISGVVVALEALSLVTCGGDRRPIERVGGGTTLERRQQPGTRCPASHDCVPANWWASSSSPSRNDTVARKPSSSVARPGGRPHVSVEQLVSVTLDSVPHGGILTTPTGGTSFRAEEPAWTLQLRAT